MAASGSRPGSGTPLGNGVAPAPGEGPPTRSGTTGITMSVTWEQIVSHLRRHHVVVVEKPNAVAIGWKIRNLVQMEQIELERALGGSRVVITSRGRTTVVKQL